MADFSIPGYEDLAPIGRGGSATVYRARQTSLGGRDVAIKVIADVDLDADTRRRFEQECAAAGQLSWHPNVVSTYDAGITDDNRAYLVMEYLPNGSLGTRLGQQGPLPWQDVADIGAKVADALAAAHEVGLIHRDVKPENILLSPRGEPMLGDFGIAYLTSRTRGQTAVVATIAHAAPEILAGARPDERADIYSLGSTLYTLLAGKPAFADDTDESIVTLIGRIATAPLPDLRPRGVPDALASAIEKCLDKDPARRTLDASSAQNNLHQALTGPTPPSTSKPWSATAPTVTVDPAPEHKQPSEPHHTHPAKRLAPVGAGDRPVDSARPRDAIGVMTDRGMQRASLLIRRVAALAVNTMSIVALSALILTPFATTGSPIGYVLGSSAEIDFPISALLLALFLAGSLLIGLTAWTRASPGKLLFRLRVRRLDSLGPPSPLQTLVRTALLPLDLIGLVIPVVDFLVGPVVLPEVSVPGAYLSAPLLLLAALALATELGLVLTTPQGRRGGDLAAGTVVTGRPS